MPQKLGSLPRKGSKYWTDVDAEVRIHELKERTCEHEFASSVGSEVECNKCHIGYELGSRGTLDNGHIYIDGKLVL